MHNPQRWRAIALTVCGLGAVMVAAGFLLPPATASEDARVALIALGLNGLLLGIVGALWAHRAVRAMAAHARGEPGAADVLHGRGGEGSDPEDLRVCDNCGYRTNELRSTCPKCGASLLSRRWTRRLGGVLVVIGLALAVGMGVLLVKMSPMLMHPGIDQDGMRFDGTPAQAKEIWAILAAVFVFGVTASGQGVWQLVTGRRNKYVAYFLFAIAGALCLAARWM